jgi:hypothetical protein
MLQAGILGTVAAAVVEPPQICTFCGTCISALRAIANCMFVLFKPR